MKKIIKMLLLVSAIALPSLAKADPLCTDWGLNLNLCLPLSSLQGAYGYNLNAKEKGSQALLETTVVTIKDRIAITFGGAKTSGEAMAPYVSATYGIANPIKQEGNPLSWIRPGVYGGKNFNSREWIYGLKASVDVF